MTIGWFRGNRPSSGSAPAASIVTPGRTLTAVGMTESRRFVRRVSMLIAFGVLCILAHEMLDEPTLKKYLVSGGAHIVHVALSVIGTTGEAALVAGVLALTVDLYLKRRLTQEITQDVSAYVMSRALPRELQDEVDSFCREHSVRTELELNYTFTDIEGNDDFILMTVLLHFQVINLTDEFQMFRHVASVQKIPNAPTNAGPEMVIIPEAGAKYVFDAAGSPADYHDRGNLGNDSADGTYRMWSKQVYIPPKGSRTNAFFWSYRRQVLPKEFQDTFILTNATIRPRLEVRCPDWMDISATFGHRIDADAFTSGNPKFWVLNAGMPPFSSISIEWRNKASRPPVVPVVPVSHVSVEVSPKEDT
jgi:hypothetical protein